MHKSQSISIVSWVDQKHVLMLSTHQEPIAREGEHVCVEREVEDKKIHVESTSIHIECQTYMRGCNMADQLVGQYNVQL